MSNSSRSPSQSSQSAPFPRAIIHKRILEAAESDPSASLEEISNQVSGATPDIVDRVLANYGDPAEDTASADPQDQTEDGPDIDQDQTEDESEAGEDRIAAVAETDSDGSSTDDVDQNLESNLLSGASPGPEALTQKQHVTLEAIADHPQATQRELAEVLEVTPSTVNYRLNSISEFEWGDRREFVQTALSDGGERMDRTPAELDPDETTMDTNPSFEGDPADLEGLREQIESLEAILESKSQPAERNPPADRASPALVHRILRACMEADYVTEEDEQWLIETFMATDGNSD